MEKSKNEPGGDWPVLSVVVIGRNEGARLSQCFESVVAMDLPGGRVEIIYVDSASTDDSVERARRLGVTVIEIHPERPCAAVGRNAGWRAARAAMVLFLDGDTILASDFVSEAWRQFHDASVAVVFGSRRELNANDSIYNRVLDLDWITAPGEVEFCGGDALVRREVLQRVGGYDERLIAAEDTELCARIRALGYKILCLERRMVSHDLAIKRFSQYWWRAVRTGYAYGEVSDRIKPSDSPVWYRQARRNLLQGAIMSTMLVSSLVVACVSWSVIPLAAAIAIIAALSVRTAIRTRWKRVDPITRLVHGIHSHIVQIPIFVGQLKYRADRILGRNSKLIEYKRKTVPDRSSADSVLS